MWRGVGVGLMAGWLALVGWAEAAEGVVLRGPGYQLELVAPPGWLVDEPAGRARGFEAFVRPVRDGRERSPIAVGVTPRGPLGSPRLRELVLEDERLYRLADRRTRWEEQPGVRAMGGRRAHLRVYQVPCWGEHHLVAYLEAERAVLRLFVAEVGPGPSKELRGAFEALVRSARLDAP